MKIKTLVSILGSLAISLSAFAGEDNLGSASAAIEVGNFAEARELLASHVEEGSENAKAFFLLGKVNFAEGDFGEAVKALKKAVKLDDSNSIYYSELGTAQVNKGMGMNMFSAVSVYTSAMDNYKKAVSLDKNNIGAHIGLCRYYWNAPAIGGGSMVKAKEHAAEVLRIYPFQGEIEHALIAQKENRFDDAVAHYKKAITLNPADAQVHYDLGMLYQTNAKMLEAKASYEAALEINPNHEAAKAALAAFGA